MKADNPKIRTFEALFDSRQVEANLKQKAIRGAGLSVTSQVINYGIQTVGTIILARLLTPEDFGLVAMVAAFSLLIQNFGSNGFTEAVVQRDRLTHLELSKLFWVNLVIMIGLTLVFALLSPIISLFYGEPKLIEIGFILSFSVLLNGLTTCHFALVTRNMQFHLTSLMNILAGLFSTVLAIFAASRGFGYWALVLRRISLPLATTVIIWLFCRWRPGAFSPTTDIKAIIKFGLNTYGHYAMEYLRLNSDKIIVGKLFGSDQLGHYDRANNLAGLLPNQLTVALSGVGVATLSRLRNDPGKYLDYYSKALSILAFVGFPGSVLLTLTGKDLIMFLLGPQWDKAGDIFTALGPSVGIVIVYGTNIWLHLSLGRPDRLIKWSTFVFFGVLLSFFIGAIFGPLGVAIAYSALFYILLLPALRYAGKPLAIRTSFFLSILWKYWVAAFLGGGLIWAGTNLFPMTASAYHQQSLFIRILIGMIAYAVAYMGLILIFFKGPKPIVHLIATIKGIVKR